MPKRFKRRESGPNGDQITLVIHGDVSDEESEYARDRLQSVLAKIREPVLLARVKLTIAPDPARARPVIAQALLDVNGDLIRAQVAAETPQVAADLLKQRLLGKLEHRSQRLKALRERQGVPEPGEWRHGDLPTSMPDYFDRPLAERQLVRRKTYAFDELTPDEAVFEMEQLDYDFHLFTDLTSGQDTFIEREGEANYRLTRLLATDAELGSTRARIVLSSHPAPALSVEEAISQLEATGRRFLFYANSRDHRGNVVYHRYDGHYGLISPV